MSKIISTVLFVLVCLSFACNNGNGSNINDGTHVNTIKFFPQNHSTVFIEDIADTSFFRVLSTDQDFLLSTINKVYFSDSLMIIPQPREGRVYLYGLDGSPVRKIELIGRSAGKLSSITDTWYNSDYQTIDIYNASFS